MATLAAIAEARNMGKLTHALFTPWESSTTEGTNPSYSLDEMLADSVSLDQDDATVNDIENELKDEPILQIATLGQVKVSLSSVGIPNELLKDAFGYTIDDDGNAYRPSTYKSVWGKFEFAFDSSPDVIEIPRVMVNAKITGSSLKTSAVVGAISGTAYSKDYTATIDGTETTISSPYMIRKDGKAGLPTV